MVVRLSQAVRLEFAAEDQVGFGSFGTVIIKEKVHKTLHKYQLQVHKNYVYQEIWREDFPHHVNTASIRAVYGNQPLLEDKKTSSTLVLSSDGRKLVDSWHHTGVLLTCLPEPDRPVYAAKNSNGGYEIVFILGIKDKSEIKLVRLQPVEAIPTWSHPYLSICEASEPDRKAVTSHTDHTLDIYSGK